LGDGSLLSAYVRTGRYGADMPPTPHSSGEIASFVGDGETRLIAAAYRDPTRAGELYILEDGTARDVRVWSKGHLRCFFPDCPQPELKTVSRARRRDGFSHLPGARKHAPESINHLQGKAVIAAWLVRRFGVNAVHVEAATDTQRTRVADVMLTLPRGQRVAFEVQYAALSVEQWRARHESYVAQGVLDVWLWGHTRVKKSRSEWDPAPFTLEDMQDEARLAGLPVLFLNPEFGQIAVAVSDWEEEAAIAFDSSTQLLVDDLDNFTVDEMGITSDTLRRLHEVSSRRRMHLEAEERRRLEREQEEAARREQRQRESEEFKARRREKQAEAAARAALERANRPIELVDIEPVASVTPASAETEPGAPWTHCRSCGGELDPILQARGYHVASCDPQWRTRRVFRRS
jgi:hypothetical protein